MKDVKIGSTVRLNQVIWDGPEQPKVGSVGIVESLKMADSSAANTLWQIRFNDYHDTWNCYTPELDLIEPEPVNPWLEQFETT